MWKKIKKNKQPEEPFNSFSSLVYPHCPQSFILINDMMRQMDTVSGKVQDFQYSKKLVQLSFSVFWHFNTSIIESHWCLSGHLETVRSFNAF